MLKVVLIHLPIIPSERDGTVVSPSEDGLCRRGMRRDCKGDVEYSPNILQNSPTGRIHDIRGIEPLVQDMLPEQPVSSLVIQSCGAVRNNKVEDGGTIGDGDADDVEEGEPVEPCPTYSKVFQAISTLNRYTEHVVDPAACKFEEALASFAYHIWLTRSQALTTTHITDFFQHI